MQQCRFSHLTTLSSESENRFPINRNRVLHVHKKLEQKRQDIYILKYSSSQNLKKKVVGEVWLTLYSTILAHFGLLSEIDLRNLAERNAEPHVVADQELLPQILASRIKFHFSVTFSPPTVRSVESSSRYEARRKRLVPELYCWGITGSFGRSTNSEEPLALAPPSLLKKKELNPPLFLNLNW